MPIKANKQYKRKRYNPHLKLKAFMVENQITHQEMAELLGISRPTVSLKINGYNAFTWDEVEKICQEYNVMPDVFLTSKVAR